jgi:hypothetical protein
VSPSDSPPPFARSTEPSLIPPLHRPDPADQVHQRRRRTVSIRSTKPLNFRSILQRVSDLEQDRSDGPHFLNITQQASGSEIGGRMHPEPTQRLMLVEHGDNMKKQLV